MSDVFSPADREALRNEILDIARADPRISGGAVTGSASTGNEDRWSDVDLAFGVRDAALVRGTLTDLSDRMYRDHGVLHHVDVVRGSWIYRVFLLPNTLQVDLAFAPASDFGARAPSFRLAFGSASEPPHVPPPDPDELIGYGWLYALHARSSIARGRAWQAEYMISAMRDHVLALACLRFDLPAREARGVDRLPQEVLAPLADCLVRGLDPNELRRAFRATTNALQREAEAVDPARAARLRPALETLTSSG